MNRKLTKPQLIACIIISSVLLDSVIFIIAFSPVSLYIKPYVNLYEINVNDSNFKNIGSMTIIGSPKIGFNILEVCWPVWSDCGPLILEIVQYNIFRKEINIWILGRKSPGCPQVAAWVDHTLELFIPLPGTWKIRCNNAFMVFNVY